MQYDEDFRCRLAAAVENASASESVALVLEETVRSLEIVVWAIEQDDILRRCRYVERAMNLVAYLYGQLDMEQGGEVAANLGRSYRIVLARLVLINPRNDAALAREAIQLIRPLLEAWRLVGRGTDADLGAVAPAASALSTCAPAAQLGA